MSFARKLTKTYFNARHPKSDCSSCSLAGNDHKYPDKSCCPLDQERKLAWRQRPKKRGRSGLWLGLPEWKAIGEKKK